MKTKKLLSLLLALMMMLSVVPMYASAADPVALTTSNVTEWPTATFINEAMYFGQKVEDAVTLSGGKVEYNGQSVAGHFEFIDPTFMPTAFGTQRADIKFISDDITLYTGFEAKRCRYVTYAVSKTTPVFVDEINDPLVATKVEAGATLSTSTISGGKMVNPYNPDEPKILARSWEWSSPNTVVTESGYYEAKFIPGNYNATTAQIYVEIAVDIIESEISAIPTISDLIYDGVTIWNDITLSGGIAVEKDTTNVVEGTFAITDSWKWQVIEAGTYEIDVTFTPNDTEAYTKVEFKIPVTVNPAFIKFVDENGAEIVPEITVPYGTKLTDGNMRYYISQAGCTAVAGNDGCWYDGTDADGYIFGTSASGEAPEVGTHYYEFIARPYTTVGVTSNYAETVLKLKVTVTPVEAEMKLDTTPIKGTDGLELWVWNKDTSSAANPQGTFTVYLDGTVYKDNVKYGEHFTWQPAESKTYEFKATYTPTENDPFTIADFTLTRILSSHAS